MTRVSASFTGWANLPTSPFSVELAYQRKTPDEETALVRFAIDIGNAQLALFTPAPRFFMGRADIPMPTQVMSCSEITDSEEFWRLAVDHAARSRHGIVANLTGMLAKLETKNRGASRPDAIDDWKKLALPKLKGANEFFGGEPTRQDLLNWFRQSQLGSTIVLNRLQVFPAPQAAAVPPFDLYFNDIPGPSPHLLSTVESGA